MLILGEEPPFVEQPDPRFGEVVKKLNEISFLTEENVANFNQSAKDVLSNLRNKLNDFIIGSIVPIDQHLALRGAVHGETKATIGLNLKDNYRVATTLETQTYAEVNAFVTPQGAKAALDKSTSGFVLSDYQLNNVFQFASFYYPDEYPITIPAAPEPVRYLDVNKAVPILINGDRLIYSPKSDTVRFSGQLIFAGLPLNKSSKNRLNEVSGVTSSYLGNNWNSTGAYTSNGSIAFFRPLADKKIYNYKTALTLPVVANQSYLLYRAYTNGVYKGMGVSVAAGTASVTIHHRFFYVANDQTDPRLTDIVTSAYLASLERIGIAKTTIPINGSHAYNLSDFVTVPTGAVMINDTNELGPVTSMFWNAEDYEIYLNVSLPVVVTLGVLTRRFYLTITESWIPGTLSAGGVGVITQVGSRVKDVLDGALNVVGGGTYLKESNRFDMNNPTQLPGVVLNSGMMVKALSTKYGLRVKRIDTQTEGLKDWLLKDKPFVHVSESTTEMFAPARHSPFGYVPERIVPVNHEAGQTQYLVYGLSAATGKFEWSTHTWHSGNIISTQTPNNYFGVRSPDIIEANKTVGTLPKSLMIRGNRGAAGVTVSALAFTTENGFRAKASFSHTPKGLVLGEEVTIPFLSMLPIQNACVNVLERARLANPAVDDSLREAQIQIYMVTANRCLVVITDGISYAEATVRGYTINGNKCDLEYEGSSKYNFQPITVKGRAPTGTKRVSESADNVWMNSADLLVTNKGGGSYDFLLTRAFGKVYGDLSFNVDGFDQAATVVFGLQFMNAARFYNGVMQIDCVEELFPAILVPNLGIMQSVSPQNASNTEMLQVAGNLHLDPFLINETGWVRMPAGSRVVLGGKTFILSQDYPIKVFPTGKTYCYMQRVGETLVVLGTTVKREVVNSEILFGTATNGVLTLSKDYLVINNHVISATRTGSAIPVFTDDGALGTNTFFTRRDVL